ncbi:MAG: hypothetical protein E7418_00320 [Ruminococcaceae bacterium]|nr:hypothetical protein [Oscillospiraceae bacterium]
MINLADIIALCIIILLGGWGMKKGFVRSIYSLGSLVLSLILAVTLYQPVTDFIDNSAVGVAVRSNIHALLVKESQNPQAANPEAPLNLPQTITNNLAAAATDVTNAAANTMAESIATLAMKLLGIVIVFILVKLILWVVLRFLDVVSKLPVIHSANKLLGGALGVLYGVLAIYLILALLTLFTTFSVLNIATEIVLNSKIVSQMYNQNFLLNFLQ